MRARKNNERRTSQEIRAKKLLQHWIPTICVIIGLVWMGASLYLFSFSFQEPIQRNIPLGIGLLHSPEFDSTKKGQEQSMENDSLIKKNSNDKNNNNKRRNERQPKGQEKGKKNDTNNNKKKDKTDYRTINIETPSPKQHHEGKIQDILTNLTATHPIYVGREKLVKMLLEMWIDVTQIDDSIWKQVPLWEDITKAHGKSPVIYGLNSCAAFRESVPEFDRRVGIAGMFNTGTNLLAILLQHNCVMESRIKKLGRKKGHGMEWQVPWGKHSPAWYRGEGHVKNFIGKIDPDNLLVTTMVRHPHDWMSSMCRHGYTAKWNHTSQNCPNLYNGNEVNANFGPGPSHHASLAHMWNDWNGAYYNATFPRLLVRFEDVIFFPKETARRVCSCVGGKLFTPKEHDGLFHYVIDSAKVGVGHGPGLKRNGLIDAWIKYGKPLKIQMKESDLKFAAEVLNQKIMSSFNWDMPPIP